MADKFFFNIDTDLTEKLNHLSLTAGTTHFMILLAIFYVLISKYSGQEDIIIGFPISGRNHTDLQEVLGMFVNTLPMRNFPKGNKSFIEFLLEVKENSLSVLENQDYQFEKLIEQINLKRDPSRNPLFDIVFAMQNMDKGKIKLDYLEIIPFDYYNKTAKFDLTLNAAVEMRKILLSFEYCTKLFRKETIERIAGHYINILQQITENPDKRLLNIELLTEYEIKQLLYDFNETHAKYPQNKLIQDLFEEQVNKTPDQTAVLSENIKLTYQELNFKANQLARILRKKGINSNEIVGMILERFD